MQRNAMQRNAAACFLLSAASFSSVLQFSSCFLRVVVPRERNDLWRAFER
jgi:hypothetical protein